MKKTFAIILSFVFALTAFSAVGAQAGDTIWLAAPVTSFKTGETVVVTVNAISGTPVQGLTFQIRYDPACLKPVSVVSPLPGMNGLPLPQTPGLLDATFASGAPQSASGILSEARFEALAQCDSVITLESAALAIRNEAGFASPLGGVTLGERNIPVKISAEKGVSQLPSPVAGGTPLSFNETSSERQFPSWLIILFSLLAGVIGVLVAVNLLRKP